MINLYGKIFPANQTYEQRYRLSTQTSRAMYRVCGSLRDGYKAKSLIALDIYDEKLEK